MDKRKGSSWKADQWTLKKAQEPRFWKRPNAGENHRQGARIKEGQWTIISSEELGRRPEIGFGGTNYSPRKKGDKFELLRRPLHERKLS